MHPEDGSEDSEEHNGDLVDALVAYLEEKVRSLYMQSMETIARVTKSGLLPHRVLH